MADVIMECDPRDVWPDDVVPGTFHVEQCAVAGYPKATAHILFVCPNNRRCGVLLGPEPVDRPSPEGLCIWGWDGNFTAPTITPSIDCAGGCGWHGYITAGEMR